jgi:hypothetical protein
MPAVDRSTKLHKLVADWTLLGDEQALLVEKRGRRSAVRFAVLLKFYSEHGQSTRGRSELPDEAIRFWLTS